MRTLRFRAIPLSVSMPVFTVTHIFFPLYLLPFQDAASFAELEEVLPGAEWDRWMHGKIADHVSRRRSETEGEEDRGAHGDEDGTGRGNEMVEEAEVTVVKLSGVHYLFDPNNGDLYDYAVHAATQDAVQVGRYNPLLRILVLNNIKAETDAAPAPAPVPPPATTGLATETSPTIVTPAAVESPPTPALTLTDQLMLARMDAAEADHASLVKEVALLQLKHEATSRRMQAASTGSSSKR